jgi:hypothetical protein
MLLRALFDLAVTRRLLADPAFAEKSVRYLIDLDAQGGLLAAGPEVTGDESGAKQFLCPATTRKKTGGGVAEFLADGITGVFGLDPDPEAEMKPAKREKR